MLYVSLKKSKTLSVLALAVIASSCSLKSNGQQQTLTIALPGANFVQNPILKSMTEWISLAWASPTTSSNLDTDPASLSEFDCFAVNVNGPGINLDPNVSCTDPADAPAILGGFVPNGNASIDLVVPAGPDRTIKILGVKSLIGCPNFRDMLQDGAINFKNVGHFYEIGSTRQDIFSDASVTIKASYSSTSAKRAFDQCKRSNGTDDGTHLWGVYAGTGPGTVNASKTVNGSTFVTGKFDYIGPNTHSGVMLSQTTGSIAGSNIAHINGVVNCATPDGWGGYYVGGSFTGVESTLFTNAGVLHIASDGSWDKSFVIKLDTGAVNTCLRDGAHLYLGGSFTQLTYNSASANAALALADFNLETKTTADLGFIATFGASPLVNSISLSSNRLYVGGYFSYAGGTHQHAVAIALSPLALDGNWHPDPNNMVNAVLSNGASSVYLGGNFTAFADSATRNHLARVDGATGATDATWNANPTIMTGSMSVSSVVSDGLNLFAAVNFSPGPKVYRFDLATGTGASNLFTANTSETINTLALSTLTPTPMLYIGGKFAVTSATPIKQGVIAFSNPSTAPSASAIFSANTNALSSVKTIVPDAAGRLYVGGDFHSIGGNLRNNIAAFDLSSGTPTAWAPTGSMGEGTSLATDGSAIFVGYKADSAHSILGGVKKFTSTASASLLNEVHPNTYSGEDVNTIALSSDNVSLYVGGTFNSMAGQGSLPGLARLSLSNLTYDGSWTPTVTAASGPPSVNAIIAKSDRVFVGGSFNIVNAGTYNGLVALNTSGSSAIAGWSNAGLTQGVQTMTLLPSGDLAVATLTSGGSPVALIKKISATSGASLTWSSGQTDILPSGMLKTYALLASGGYLYIGGLADGSSGSSLMAFDLTQGLFNAGFDPHLYNMYNTGNNYVSSIESPSAGSLMVGGQYSQANVTNSAGAGGKEALGIGLFDENTGVYY
ncbi:MAG: hypothetical protein ACJ763_17185 [Bdellovibrionia bacterium]